MLEHLKEGKVLLEYSSLTEGNIDWSRYRPKSAFETVILIYNLLKVICVSVEIMAKTPLKQIMKGSSANTSTAENLLLVETNPSSPTSKDFITPSCTFCCDCRIIPQRL